MKKNLIALMMSIVMVIGSVGGSSVFAAETTDESSTTESAVEETADGIVTPNDIVTKTSTEKASETVKLEDAEKDQRNALESEKVEDGIESITWEYAWF